MTLRAEAPCKRARVGLADLARMLCGVPVEDRLEAAAVLGFRRAALPPKPREEPVEPDPRLDPRPLVDRGDRAGFFRVASAKDRVPAMVPGPRSREQGLTGEDLQSNARAALPEPPPLAPWSTLWPALRRALHSARPRRDPDVAALVRTWARGECLPRLPRLERRTWAALAELWIDRSRRLTPFWDDQAAVYEQLVRLCGRAAIRPRIVDASALVSLVAGEGGTVDRSVPVLVLGDLGFYGTSVERALWLRTAERLRLDGVRIAALVPCPRRRWDREVARAWNAAPWERARTVYDRDTLEAHVRALLRLVAPTALAQPGLLRALRQLTTADVSTEVDVWQHADVQAADVHGLVLKTEAAIRWRKEFKEQVDPAIQARVGRLMKEWHGCWRAELFHAETLAWIAHGLPGGPGGPGEPGERGAAQEFTEKLEATLCGGGSSREVAAMLKHYGRRLLGAVPDQVYSEFPALKRVWHESFASIPDARWPSTIDPRELADARRVGQVPQRWAAHQQGEVLIMVPEATPTEGALGSPVTTIVAIVPVVRVQQGTDATRIWLTARAEIPLRPGERITLRTDGSEVTLEVWERVPWAVAAGRDRYGLWAAFEVQGVQQRLRWIPPGRFLMGSPPEEAGRYDDEGPQHWVTLTKGYWLGETPVTQALWRAVMTSNPSRFQSSDRPVEQVSWDNCQTFIERLNRSLDGLVTRLPSEAEWERACRAGTTTATWVGDLTLRGAHDAPELDAIAWYGGNSGVDFELDDGWDSSDWPEKQHPHTRAGTHPVGRRQANPYGLQDMLGNVYEWCQDAGLRSYGPEPVDDPVSRGRGSSRVRRGGSWSSYARLVRAADRFAPPHDARGVLLGFRLAGGQESAPSPRKKSVRPDPTQPRKPAKKKRA